MDNEQKAERESLSPGEIIDRTTQELLAHDPSTQVAVLDEIRGLLIEDYSRRRDGNLKSAAELDHGINILKGNVPTKVSSDGPGDVYVERKNYRG